ncbi:uncharacterized protein clmna [Cololabis saira]|uniref:uncharacterized protein clmna n=1 Tax=Cololabis saira TaxID=129043 RepID=UPI002AD5566C|nr:uncharacterized protein clmna [Cololabis saira]
MAGGRRGVAAPGWFEREEFIGQISDLRVQNLQVEREAVQKRTFTRWMNLHLEKCEPPLQVQDLFQDIQDGHALMALLEELSGCSLLHGFRKSTHRIFRLNNIAKVLSFLEERNVKLVSIDAADVADGNSSIILGLIWNIILFFQIKELTGNIRSQFPSSCSLSCIPTGPEPDPSGTTAPPQARKNPNAAMRENSKAIRKLLHWVQTRTRKFGVAVQNFSSSWTSGLAFLALIKSIDSSLVDMRKSLLRSSRENMEDAFRIAHFSLGIPRLLEPEDVAINAPDEQSIIMYVSQFLEHFPGIEEPEEPRQPMERSVSMGRLNLREVDPDPLRNGALRGTVRQRSCMFQRDQPPPKVWISSVSVDRSVASPRFRPAAVRSWSTEEFLSDSALVEDVPSVEVGQQPDAQLLSSAPESAIGDSAINSPDSWADGELMAEVEDDGSPWELYRATPVDVTPMDEGFLSSLEDRALDDRSTPGSYIDEEMDNVLGTNLPSDPTETDATKERDRTDVRLIQKEDEPRDQVSFTSVGPEDPLTTDRLDQSITSVTQTPPHQESFVGEDGDRKDRDGPTDVQPENLQQRTHFEEHEHQEAGSPPEDERYNRRNEAETLEERNDGGVETHREVIGDLPLGEETSSSEAANQEEASRISLNIPLISISGEPDKPDDDGASDPGRPGPDQDKGDLGQIDRNQNKGDLGQFDPNQDKGDLGQFDPNQDKGDLGQFDPNQDKGDLGRFDCKQDKGDLGQFDPNQDKDGVSDLKRPGPDQDKGDLGQLDPDQDKDGVSDLGKPNPDQDKDGVSDLKRPGPDQDKDGVSDLGKPNPDQDKDGVSDLKRPGPDQDKDGVSDLKRPSPDQDKDGVSDRGRPGPDQDKDGVSDRGRPDLDQDKDDLGQFDPNQDKDGVPDLGGPGPDQKGGAGQRKVSGCERTNTKVSSPDSSDGPKQASNKDDHGVPVESPSSPISENIKPTSHQPVILTEHSNEHSDDLHECDSSSRTRSGDGEESSKTEQDSRSTPDYLQTGQDVKRTGDPPLTNTATDNSPDGQRGPVDGHLDTEMGNAHQNTSDPVQIQHDTTGPEASQPNHQIGMLCSEPSRSRSIDLFYADSGRGSPTEDVVADLEPMDLFYPDKEEPVFTEPPDADTQRWPSVLSVSALEPAPVYEHSAEVQDLDQREVDVTTAAGLVEELDRVIVGPTNQEPGDAPASEEQCVMCGVPIGETVGETVRGVQGAESPADAGEVRDSISHTGSSSRPGETEIAPVLRHRKRKFTEQPTDGDRTASRSARQEDSELWFWLLLLLWLLLYSVWLLPQTDLKILKILPDLLLNRD